MEVLVTGAASGIGYHLVHYLADKDYTVFAGVRKEEDLQLFNHDRIQAVLLDVTSQDHILAFSKRIQQLDLLVNNAGVGPLGFLSSFSEEDMIHLFNVNVFGPWRLTKALVPQLVKAKGMVINIGSMGGTVNKPLFGPYSMTKFALEAYTDVLRGELAESGVRVAIIQPGAVRTSIGEKSGPSIRKRLEDTPPPFDTQAKLILEGMKQKASDYDPDLPEGENNRKYSEPEAVSRTVIEALNQHGPKYRYLLGSEWEGNRVLNELMKKLLEENDNPSNDYSLSELIERLKKHARDYYVDAPERLEQVPNHLLGVGAVIIHEGKVVLIKQKYGVATELWLFPGGYVERGETLEEAVGREVLEETNLKIKPVKVIGIRSFVRPDGLTDVYTIFSCGLLSPPESINRQESEIADLAWFDLEGIEKQEGISEYTRKVLSMATSDQGMIRDHSFDGVARKRLQIEKYEQYWF
ncbi:MAG: SDR family NAD(P)-dependent oxidoreductase [Candidatus Kariarchaeaceae archaeon]|jgi:short-subunit dehydrogenase/ADP-ribose pyrophosphatase YjhB (NUDIX family)